MAGLCKTELNEYLRGAKRTNMQSILIADDHDIVRFGLSMMLKEFFPGYIVDEAWDAESVIEQMRKKEYQLIFSTTTAVPYANTSVTPSVTSFAS